MNNADKLLKIGMELGRIKTQFEDLKEENKKLKEENKHIFANVNDDELLRSNAMNWAEKNKLQERINKAIEYIEKNKEGIDDCFEPYIGLSEIEIEELLKILKGEENE